jgi:hypothetical protein
MTTQISQSVIANNPNCTSNPEQAYLGLIQLRTLKTRTNTGNVSIAPDITGRLSGNNIKFDDKNTYEEYKMRRKAEVLKYRTGKNATGYTMSAKKTYSEIAKNGGNYSQNRLNQIVNQANGIVPDKCKFNLMNWKISTPSQSGVVDYKIPGYYLDPFVTYYPSL